MPKAKKTIKELRKQAARGKLPKRGQRVAKNKNKRKYG
jgi:hypothetical protein